MNHPQEKDIAAQALKALHLRRQLERGELTQQEYLDRLNALQKPAVPDAAPAPGRAQEPAREPGSGKHRPLTGPAPRLTGALEVLQLRRRLDNGELTPQQYLAELRTQPEAAPAVVQELAPVPTGPAAEPAVPAAPAIVTAPVIPERFVAMNCPRCSASLRIYDHLAELQCGGCGEDVVVERKDCTIALRIPAELIEKPDAVSGAAASAQRGEELKKLRAEAAMVANVKRSAGILGGLCGVGFAYMGILYINARDIVMGAGILFCGGALLGTVICITRHTTRVRADLTARIRAITPSEEYSAGSL